MKLKTSANQHEHNDQKYFLCCHVRHLNPSKIQKELHKRIKKLANDLNYDKIEFPVDKKDFGEFETKNNNCINVYCYENKLTFQMHI